MHVTESFGDYSGNKFRYLKVRGSTGSGAVLMHGYSFSADTWVEAGTVAAIAGIGYSVASIDLPGYPNSRSRFHLKFSDYIDFVGAATEVAMSEAGRPALLGASASGHLAMAYAAARPDSIGALIVVGPVGIDDVELERIGVPTLAVWGSEDEVSDPDKGRTAITGRVRSADEVVIEGAGHACYLDKPEAFNNAVVGFLLGLGAARP